MVQVYCSNKIIKIGVCSAIIIPANSPGFAGRLPVSMVISWSPISEPKQYFPAFSKQSRKSGLSPLLKRGDFGRFF